MTDEEGLRGGWFSGKVLRIDKVQAYVVYDEILDDDGNLSSSHQENDLCYFSPCNYVIVCGGVVLILVLI